MGIKIGSSTSQINQRFCSLPLYFFIFFLIFLLIIYFLSSPTNIEYNVKGDQVIVRRKIDVTDEEFVCDNALHDLGDGIPGSAVEVPLALNRNGLIKAAECPSRQASFHRSSC